MTIHKCDICGKVAQWNMATWRSTTYFLGRLPDWYEEDIETCSRECSLKLDAMMEGKSKKQQSSVIKSIRKQAVENRPKVE